MSRILDVIFPPRRDSLIVRSLTEEHISIELAPTDLSGAVALLPYRKKEICALIREAKFGSNERAWRVLACVLEEYLLEYLGDRLAYEERTVFLVPVPLSKKRYRERGYNQVEEVLKRVKIEGASLAKVVKRTRNTKKQTSLSRRDRLKNIEGAFTADRVDPAALYVVVDDVYTTGATLSEAVRTLKEAGARHVHAVALSH